MFGIIVSGQPRCGKSTLVKSLHSNSEILSCNVDAKILVKILSKKIDRKISLKKKIEYVIGNEVYQDSDKKIKTSIQSTHQLKIHLSYYIEIDLINLPVLRL